MSEWATDKIEELRAEITVLKAERDEAERTRDQLQQTLYDLLARIHRDGGHYVVENGFEKAVEDAHELIVQAHVLQDREALLS